MYNVHCAVLYVEADNEHLVPVHFVPLFPYFFIFLLLVMYSDFIQHLLVFATPRQIQLCRRMLGSNIGLLRSLALAVRRSNH
jgi:hypothetical protein